MQFENLVIGSSVEALDMLSIGYKSYPVLPGWFKSEVKSVYR